MTAACSSAASRPILWREADDREALLGRRRKGSHALSRRIEHFQLAGIVGRPLLLSLQTAGYLAAPASMQSSASREMSDHPSNDAPYRLIDDVTFGENVVVFPFTNLYGCEVGDNSRIGPFVEIQKGARIGANCKIQSHAFICTGVEIEDEVFVSHGVMFINDKYPRATVDGRLQAEDDWELLPTIVERQATLGSGAIVLGGVRIGRGALVGAGAVVTRDVEPGQTVAGSPARALRRGGPDT
jgi:UDP-2-acetamido-3-amino-2,3-dideoxy-glucuronate N-acetyltransferase